MEIVRLLCLVCTVTLVIARPEKKHLFYHDLEAEEKGGVFHSIPGDCFCPLPDDNSVLVSDLFGRNNAYGNEYLEQVVVVVYRDPNTNEIILHTPSKLKQSLFPVIPYDDGDNLLKVGTETVHEVFENNLQSKSVYLPKTSQVTSLNPIDFAPTSAPVKVTRGDTLGVRLTSKKSKKLLQSNSILNKFGVNGCNNCNKGKHNHEHHNDENHNLLEDSDSDDTGVTKPLNELIDKIRNNKKKPDENVNSNQAPAVAEALEKPKDVRNFHQWFKDQLNLNPNLADTDVKALKQQILKTLQDNNLRANLFVRNGDNVDWKKLQLHETIIEEKPVSVNDRSPLRVEGVMLLYSNNPLQILGVIPTKKSYNPTQDKLPEPVNEKETEPENETEDKPDRDIYESIKQVFKTFGDFIQSAPVTDLTNYFMGKEHNSVPPGYRIIGGKHALNSGTPLSYKGRTGYKAFFDKLNEAI